MCSFEALVKLVNSMILGDCFYQRQSVNFKNEQPLMMTYLIRVSQISFFDLVADRWRNLKSGRATNRASGFL